MQSESAVVSITFKPRSSTSMYRRLLNRFAFGLTRGSESYTPSTRFFAISTTSAPISAARRAAVVSVPNYKLGTLVEHFKLAEGLPDELKPHRATYDTLVTARLFVRLAETAGSLEELRGQPPEKAAEDALF